MNRRRLQKLGVIFGFWTFFALLYASQIYIAIRSEGMFHSWRRIVAWQLLDWYAWGCLTPLILWLGQRFPIARKSWGRGLLVHLTLSAILAAIHIAINVGIKILIEPFDVHSSTLPFGEQYVNHLMGGFHFDFLIYWAILGVSYAFTYYDKYREREVRATQLEAQLAQAQLQTLKMQLHPHFLFNTLNGIAGLVRDQLNQEAVRMITGLSELLRHTLDNAGKQEVSLREELESLELYLDIQQMRFSDRLRVRMEIAPETLDARVPNLILQPLVENAIRHGIARRATPGLLGVSSRRDDGLLQIKVYDDGPGLRRDWQLEDAAGIGLANTRARLQQLYGTRHRFDVRNRAEGGVEATLTIVFRPNGEEVWRDGEEEDQNSDS